MVIKLEGGTDFDLTILDRAPSPERKPGAQHDDDKEGASSGSKRERRKESTRSHSRSPSRSPATRKSIDKKSSTGSFIVGRNNSFIVMYSLLLLTLIGSVVLPSS